MVVRGLVRRVVRGVGSVGSPRSGGQFFQLSQNEDPFFFPGEIIKFQLSLPLSGKMNEMNALTPTNTGYRRVAFSLCTKVCEKKAKLSEAVPYLFANR